MSHVELPHGTLHYHESGAGAPVVFLHGYLTGSHRWDPVVHLAELARRGAARQAA